MTNNRTKFQKVYQQIYIISLIAIQQLEIQNHLANKLKQYTFMTLSQSRTLVLLVLFSILLVLPVESALNQQSQADIKAAIKAAVLDGLNLVDTQMRLSYWYYLRGSTRVAFNVTIQRDRLNYVILYNNIGNYFRVNCDLMKVNWKTSLNSFVKVVRISQQNINSILTLDQKNNTIDLTNDKSFQQNLSQQNGVVPLTQAQQKPQVLALNPSVSSGNLVVNNQQ